MKTKLLVWVLLIASLSCCTSTEKPVSDAEKSIIKKEVKKIVNIFFTGREEAKFNLLMSKFYDSPDFRYIYNGDILTYDDCLAGFKPLFKNQINKNDTILNEKYAVLDNSTVLYTAKIKSVTNYKDGHSTHADPGALLLVFKRIDIKWQIIYGIESSVVKSISAKNEKKLNQLKLFRKFAGRWKGKYGKDTTFTWIGKYSGGAIEGNIKIRVKRRKVTDVKVVNVYDKSSDKFIQTEICKGTHPQIYVSWFISKNTCVAIQFKDFMDPEKASIKTKFEFKSPNAFIQTTTINNIPTDTVFYYRK